MKTIDMISEIKNNSENFYSLLNDTSNISRKNYTLLINQIKNEINDEKVFDFLLEFMIHNISVESFFKIKDLLEISNISSKERKARINETINLMKLNEEIEYQ